MILFFYNLALLAALVVGRALVALADGDHAKVPRRPAGTFGHGPGFARDSSKPIDLAPRRLSRRSAGRQPPGEGTRPGTARLSNRISTTTRTGQVWRVSDSAQPCLLLPAGPALGRARVPERAETRLFVLAETEFWPNLLSGCFRRGIPVAVVNARISDRSWPRYRRLRRFWRPLLSQLSRAGAERVGRGDG
jgi:3-deoxy-D-manno-octulosonic-acid transferase